MDGVLSVGELLRDRRRELGWSLAGVAGKLDDLGVSISTSQKSASMRWDPAGRA